MKIDRIDIQIITSKENKYGARKYGDVAFLVDRDDFLADVWRLRNKWGLLGRLMPHKQQLTHEFLPRPKITPKIQREFENAEQLVNDLNFMRKLEMKNPDRRELFRQRYLKAVAAYDPTMAFDFDIRGLRKKYHRPANFDLIIERCIVNGIVKDDDYRTYKITEITPEWEYIPYEEDETDSEIAVVVYPFASKDEIYSVVKKQLSKTVSDYMQRLGIAKGYDTRDTIANVRNWYWGMKTGKYRRYRDIAIELCGGIAKYTAAKRQQYDSESADNILKRYEKTEKSVAAAVERYQDILATPIFPQKLA